MECINNYCFNDGLFFGNIENQADTTRKIKGLINELGKDVNEENDIIDNLVECNYMIDKYALELDKSSKNVTSITEEVLISNKDNKQNVISAKENIDKLSQVTDRLGVCI